VITAKDRAAVLEVLDSGKWWWGDRVKEFEAKFAAFQDAKYGISCVNGTAALEICCVAAGIGAGHEVITTPYTFVGTAAAILRANAIPVFVDVEPETMNLDPSKIEAAITPRTKGIMPVHFGGLPCDMEKINKIAKKHDLIVIEDACHAWGTKFNGKGAGALGDLGAFSFQMSKNITAAEGGIVLSDNELLADAARSYANVGRGKGGGWYQHFRLGTNYRMTELQAALLLSGLTRLEAQTKKRQENAEFLNEEISKIPGLKIMREDKRAHPRSYHLYGFRFIAEEWDGVTRAQFVKAMSAEGIGLSTGYPYPLYKNPMFIESRKGARGCPRTCPYLEGHEIDYTKAHCPGAEQVCREILWFSQVILLGSRNDMKDIVKAAKKVRDNIAEARTVQV
jgi:dTDP-4-amino-4,6-dideoxygalactose transaminase